MTVSDSHPTQFLFYYKIAVPRSRHCSIVYFGVTTTLMLFCSDEDKHAFEAWQAHDDAEDNFCELDGKSSPTAMKSSLFLLTYLLTYLLKPTAHGEERAEQTASRGGLLSREEKIKHV